MDVITLGEMVVLFTPNTNGALRYADDFTREFSGPETNVAIGLSKLGHQTGWISKIGNDEFGRAMLTYIRGEGVDVSQVKVDNDAPTGLYFQELKRKNEQRLYDYSKHSAAVRLSSADVNEAYIENSRYLYLSGASSLISEGTREIVTKLIEVAKRKEIPVIFDPNLRRVNLLSNDKKNALSELMNKADVILLDEEERAVFIGMLHDDSKKIVAKNQSTESQHVDRVSEGDGFVIGYISGLLDGLNEVEAIKRGSKLSSLVKYESSLIRALPNRTELGV